MKARILIADDHEVIRTGLRSLLASQPGWEVVSEAEDGWTAVAQAVRTRPDVAVIDYSLPALNGIEVTRQIRASSPETEILIFTLHSDAMLLAEAMKAGARGFVLKSEVNSSLVAAISSVVEHKPFYPTSLTNELEARGNIPGNTDQHLSPREHLVVEFIAKGLTNQKIAERLGLSVKTIETHRAAAMRKIGAGSTADIVRYALRNRLLEP